ncbi:MAG TPA: MFS transporter [Gemmatimonadales bacterium]|nr:MFS transporter [Gemmatimonadales bacterium]
MTGSRGWVVSTCSAVLLMAACTLMPRTIGALGPFIVRDLGLSPSQFGSLVSAIFFVSAACAIGSARIVDRLPATRLMRALLLLVIVDVVLVAGASSYQLLIVVVGLAGVSQGLANPVANRIVRTAVPPSRQALAIGLKQSAVQLGTAFAAFVLPSLALVFGWQQGVLALLLLPLVALAVSLSVGQSTGRGASSTGSAVGHASRPTWRGADDGTWRLAVYSFFIAAGVSGVATYVTLYAHERLGFSESTAGLVLGFVGLAAVLGRIGWAQAAGRRPESNRIAAVVAAAGAASTCLLAMAPLLGGWLVWVGAIGVGATAMGANAVSNLSVVRRSESSSTGQSSAIVAFGFFCGFIPGPVVFGLVVETTAGYYGAWAVVVLELAFAAWVVARRDAPKRAQVAIPDDLQQA